MDDKIVKKIEAFFTPYKKIEYKKGEMLIRGGDVPQFIWYLTKGYVKKYAISKKGDEVVVNIFKPISFFPMSHAVNDAENNYYYEALTDVIASKAPKEDVKQFIQNSTDVLYDLLQRVYRGTDGMENRMTFLMGGSAYERVITEILIYLKRFSDLGTKQPDHSISMRISEKDLAASSGMTRETVSREMRVLKEKKLISFEKNQLLVFSIKQLEKELST